MVHYYTQVRFCSQVAFPFYYYTHVACDFYSDNLNLITDGIVSDVLRAYLGKYGKKWDGREVQKIAGKTPLEAATAVVEDYGLSCTSSELLSEINPIFSNQ